MRTMILLPLLAALFVCYCSTVQAQMTFSDHWSKKNSFPARSSPKDDAAPMCKEEYFYQMKMEWLQDMVRQTQRELIHCRGGLRN